MASRIARLCVLAGYLILRASAACSAYGVDYSNGGFYNIDTSSDSLFSFTSVFQGTWSLNRCIFLRNVLMFLRMLPGVSETYPSWPCGTPVYLHCHQHEPWWPRGDVNMVRRKLRSPSVWEIAKTKSKTAQSRTLPCRQANGKSLSPERMWLSREWSI